MNTWTSAASAVTTITFDILPALKGRGFNPIIPMKTYSINEEDLKILMINVATSTAKAVEGVNGIDKSFTKFGEDVWCYIESIGSDFCGEEISEDILPMARASGLCTRVIYSPELHGGNIDAEPGDTIWWWGSLEDKSGDNTPYALFKEGDRILLQRDDELATSGQTDDTASLSFVRDLENGSKEALDIARRILGHYDHENETQNNTTNRSGA